MYIENIRPLRVPDAPHHRLTTIGIVIGLHIAVISAFLMGLRPHFFPVEITPTCQSCFSVPSHPKDAIKPPPPINLQSPSTDTVPKPEVPIDQAQDNSPITLPPQVVPGPVNPPVYSFPARAIVGTHTIPDYPPIDTRLGHEGTVLLKLSIDERGNVVDAVVEHSSGYASLDQAAANWVKAHWLYYPATHGGDAVTSTLDVTVTFHLTGH